LALVLRETVSAVASGIQLTLRTLKIQSEGAFQTMVVCIGYYDGLDTGLAQAPTEHQSERSVARHHFSLS
jgi:hypothetical protein